MKSILIASLVSIGVLAGGQALASEQLMKDGGCVKCHDMDKKKKGASVKSIAAKYKGKAGAADQLVADLKAEKDDHPKPKMSDADLKAVVGWMLAQ
jgi:cytochrome c